MNLLDTARLLQDAPDDYLASEMRNPSGQVPQYLLLTEMQRRKQMRDTYSQGIAARQATDQTVADRMMKMIPAPQLPPQQISSQQAVAGGQATNPQGYAVGGLVEPRSTPLWNSWWADRQRRAAEYRASVAQGFREGAPQGIAAVAAPHVEMAGNAADAFEENIYDPVNRAAINTGKWLIGVPRDEAPDVAGNPPVRGGVGGPTARGQAGTSQAVPLGLPTAAEVVASGINPRVVAPEEMAPAPPAQNEQGTTPVQTLSWEDLMKGMVDVEQLPPGTADRLAKLEANRPTKEDAKKRALLSAAGAMLSSESPFFGPGVGAGLKAGLGAYVGTMDQSRKEDLEIEEMRQKAAQNYAAQRVGLIGAAATVANANTAAAGLDIQRDRNDIERTQTENTRQYQQGVLGVQQAELAQRAPLTAAQAEYYREAKSQAANDKIVQGYVKLIMDNPRLSMGKTMEEIKALAMQMAMQGGDQPPMVGKPIQSYTVEHAR